MKMQSLTKILSKANDYFTKIEEVFIFFTSFFLTVLTLVAIFNRYFLKHTISWYEEIAMILYVILIFWGASNASKYNKLISTTILSDMFKKRKIIKGDVYLGLFVNFVCLVISLMAIYFSIKLSLTTTMKTVALHIPNYIYWTLGITLGFFGLVLRYSYKVLICLNRLYGRKGTLRNE